MLLLKNHLLLLVSVGLLIIHISSFFLAASVIMRGRTSQGTIAWVMGLLIFPYVGVPLFLLFGRSKFHGYTRAHQKIYQELQEVVHHVFAEIDFFSLTTQAELCPMQNIARELLGFSFVRANAAELLIDGEATYAAMLEKIAMAKSYICLQSFIVRNDDSGKKFKALLIEKAKQGIKVYFLYDEIGCYSLSNRYLKDLVENGVTVSAFYSTRGKGNRFQINFRNHRKVVIVDGCEGFLGGLNIGDEYLGLSKKFGHWRDTHLMISGPAVQCLQLAFLQDWYWATHHIPDFNWHITPAKDNINMLILPTGPADKIQAATLMITSLINRARERLWIASPYFVPDFSIIQALQLAAMRGVDVRILLPAKADHKLVYLCSFAFYEDLAGYNIKLYRYREGFMHQKVFVVDDAFAGVGTVNLDNRSLNINFEITAVIAGSAFIQEVAKMLDQDFAQSDLVDVQEYNQRSIWFKVAVRTSRLFSPLL